MTTAAANLLFQPSTFKWKPNRFRPLLRPLLIPPKPVKLIITSATPKSHISLRPAKKLQPLDPKSNSSSSSCGVWRFAVKLTAGVVLGAALLLMYTPKPAMAGTMGRVVATCDPLADKDPDSAIRYRKAEINSFIRTVTYTGGLSLYPLAAYYISLPLLSILCILVKAIDPSKPQRGDDHWSHRWYQWYKRQGEYFLIFLLILHVTWAWRHVPSTHAMLNIQVNLSKAGRALHTDLNRIAETAADTSTYKSVNSILTETVATILKYPDCFVSASIHAGYRHDLDAARTVLNGLSREERIRLGGHLVMNVKNLKVESSTCQKSANEIQDGHIGVDADQLGMTKHNKYDLSQIDFTRESSTSQISTVDSQDEYMEVIILVAVASKHDDGFPIIIKSWDDLKEAFHPLTSEPCLYPYAVEVLWRPNSSSSTGRRMLWFR